MSKPFRVFFFLLSGVAIAGWLTTPLYLRGIHSHPPEQRVYSGFNSIGSGVKAYKTLAGRFPTTEQGLMALVKQPTAEPLPRRWNQTEGSVPKDPWGNEYQYRLLPEGDARGFEIRSVGPDGMAGTSDDLSSLDPAN
jgi:general secretion pathway protein G